MKDLTIIVPLYNKMHYIEQCLESIKNGTHNIDWECIVVDDGSTDGSTDIAKAWCNSNTDNFTYVQCLRNHGLYPSYARNIGIRMADSKFLMFFDADDLMCDGYPERGVQFMKEHPDYYHYFESIYIVDKEENYGEYFEYYQFVPYTGINDSDYVGFLKVGGGAYTRGIFKTDEAKKFRYKDVLLEDSVYMIDYLYPCKKYHVNTNNFSFFYFVCRSEQDEMALGKLKDVNKETEREYLYRYVKEQYPDFYKVFVEKNGLYEIELKKEDVNEK